MRRVELRADHLGALAVGADVDDLASLETHLEPIDPRSDAGHDEWVGRPDDPLGATKVGRREDLFRREVRDVLDAGLVSNVAHSQRDDSSRPTTRSVPGPRKRTASNPAASSAPHASPATSRGPARRRPDRPRRAAAWSRPPPEALDVLLAEHHLGPAGVRAGTITQLSSCRVTRAGRALRSLGSAFATRRWSSPPKIGLRLTGELDDRRRASLRFAPSRARGRVVRELFLRGRARSPPCSDGGR